jgi:hypothetical protein
MRITGSWVKKNVRAKKYDKHGETYDIEVTYGLYQPYGNKYPYFSITGVIKKQDSSGFWRDVACGMIHADIAKQFPELSPLLKWHLASSMGEPMHYTVSGRYWYGQIGKPKKNPSDPDPEKAFKRTVVFGTVEGDEMPTGDVDVWMANRKERLAEAFRQTMREYGCYNEV